MNSIEDSYTNALLADATYALGVDGQPDVTGATGDTLAGFLSGRMTPTLAKYIGANFTVVTHIETADVLGSGFDATVWGGKTASASYSCFMDGATRTHDILANIDLALSDSASYLRIRTKRRNAIDSMATSDCWAVSGGRFDERTSAGAAWLA